MKTKKIDSSNQLVNDSTSFHCLKCDVKQDFKHLMPIGLGTFVLLTKSFVDLHLITCFGHSCEDVENSWK